MNNSFQWNEELVKEFIRYRWDLTEHSYIKSLAEFKKSKEVSKPDYQILSLINTLTSEISFVDNNNKIRYTEFCGGAIEFSNCTIDDAIINRNYTIHSVKRNSDSEIFTLGDTIELFGEHPTGTIYRFIIDSFDTTKISAYNNHGFGKGIAAWKKVKPQPKLFTTEDGVDIYDYNWVTVSKEFNIWSVTNERQYDPFLIGAKRFSTIEAANQYILANKPIQTSYREFSDFIWKEDRPVTPEKILEFFKSKLNP